jgi:hypothetical protein
MKTTQQAAWTKLQEEVKATFDPNWIDGDDMNYLDRFHRKIRKQMSAQQKATWKAFRKAFCSAWDDTLLVDYVLDGKFRVKAKAAHA